LKKGDIFLTYLAVYTTGRFFLEFLRLDSHLISGINTNQTIMLVIGLVSAGTLIWRHLNPEEILDEEEVLKTGPESETEETAP